MTRVALMRLFSLILVVALLTPAGAAPVQAGQHGRGYAIEPGVVLVKLRSGVSLSVLDGHIQASSAALDQALEELGAFDAQPLFANAAASATGLARIYRLAIPFTRDAAEAAFQLGLLGAVEYAEPNYIHQLEPELSVSAGELSVLPGDNLLNKLWGLDNSGQTGGQTDADIDAPEAWDIITGSMTITVAVIDSGIDFTHPELDDGRVRTDIDRDFVNNDDDAMDDNGHGTHVAGTIAAEANNGVGVSGVMWQAQLLPLKVCDSHGSCPAAAIADALYYAANHGARVVNMSLGGGCSAVIADAVNYAYYDKGVVVVASAGNSGGSVGYPARFDAAISVGATDYRDRQAYFSNYGDYLDVVAPGVTILSSVPGAGYEAFSGTSMAAPHVTGVVGLLLSQRPGLTNAQVAAILTASADDLGAVGKDRVYGAGRINAQRALLQPTPATTTDPLRALCEECAVEVALDDAPARDSLLADLRLLRDARFDAPGLIWSQLYARHQTEVLWQLVSDGELRSTAVAAINAIEPGVQVVLGKSDPRLTTLVSQQMVDRVDSLMQSLIRNGSPGLAAEVQAEWRRMDVGRFVGWSVADAWGQIKFEAQTRRSYLPLIER